MSVMLAGMTDSIPKSDGKFLSETSPLSDVVDRFFTGFRALTESPTVSDALARVFTGFRATSEDLASSIFDSISKSAGKFLSETSTLPNSVHRWITYAIALTKSHTVSDALSRVLTGLR